MSSLAYTMIVDLRPSTQISLSTLQTLTSRYEKVFKGPISNIEQITLFAAPPYSISPLITIQHNKKDSKKAHKHLVNELPRKTYCLLFYKDRSGISGKLGAAAVGLTILQNGFLGPSDPFTVYFGEHYDIFLPTEMSLEAHMEPQVVIICVDSQETITAVGSRTTHYVTNCTSY